MEICLNILFPMEKFNKIASDGKYLYNFVSIGIFFLNFGSKSCFGRNKNSWEVSDILTKN